MPTVAPLITDDAYNSGVRPAAGWNATQTYNRVGISTDKAGDTASDSFVRFDLSDIPSDAKVSAASITVFVENVQDNASNAAPGQIRRPTTSWSESSGPPTVDATSWGTIGNAGTTGWNNGATGDVTSTNIAALIEAQVNGTYPNYGLCIYAMDTPSAYRLFTSREGGNSLPFHAATMSVTYNRPPGQPGAFTVPTSGAVYAPGQTIPLAWGAATDPEGNAVVYDLYYTVNNGADNLITTGVSGTSYSWAHALPIGTGYRINVYARDPSGSGASSAPRTSDAFTIKAGGPRMIVG